MITIPGNNIPFRWSAETGLEIIDLPINFASAWAKDITEGGTITGESSLSGIGNRGWVLTAEGEFFLIEPPAGVVHSNAEAINNLEIVTGTTDYPRLDTKEAHIWQDGVMIVIGPMQLEDSRGRDIGDDSSVVGYTGCLGCVNDPDARAYIWQNGVPRLIPVFEDTITMTATAISDTGAVTGGSRYELIPFGEHTEAYLWDGKRLTALPPLNEYPDYAGLEVDDVHGVVGTATISEMYDAGWIWKGGELIDLNTVIPEQEGDFQILEAVAINNAGQIAARAALNGGSVLIFLTPVAPSGDLNSDCIVDGADLSFFLSEWGEADSQADFNEDGKVNGQDLGLLLGNWG